MNVYDFDGTVYRGDSTVDFYLFSVKRHPAALRHVPAVCLWALKKKCGKCTTREWKEVFFRFLADIPDLQAELRLFWERHFCKIYPWYHAQKRPDDVFISASPEFLLAIPAEKLGIGRLIASRVDEKTGRFDGENCKGAEKVSRFRALYPDAQIERFYSDTHSDLPMARLAEKAYLCKKGQLLDWDIKKG